MAENVTRTSPRDFLSEVVEQVKKVTWPDRAQLQSSTGIIVVFMLFVSLVIFGLDFLVRTGLNVISSLFGVG
ncbi:MAG TPA: preprotein translocase subunit SecE [Longimicrobium sp.]|jgi:preprotein translocase subunit SecE|uniref:preprotein translocase subunit SecE n=1 Tax=Longimicrobium sp. TaxID=2029185 RepID=UPI002ED9A1EA